MIVFKSNQKRRTWARFSCVTLCALRRKWDLRLLQRPMNHSLLALQHPPVLSRPPPAPRLPLSNTRYVLTHAFTAHRKRGRQGTVLSKWFFQFLQFIYSDECLYSLTSGFPHRTHSNPWSETSERQPLPLPSPPFPECTGAAPERSGLVRSPSSVLVALICVLTRRV